MNKASTKIKETSIDHLNVLNQIRLLLTNIENQKVDKRLPSERDLAQRFKLTRAKLRKILDILETEGRIWRGIGQGTFVGPKPVRLPDLTLLASKSTPAQVMRARMGIEPELAALAAVNATDTEILKLKELSSKCKASSNWREYEIYDAMLHHNIAEAAHNSVLLTLTDFLTDIRRSVNWGRPRPEGVKPPQSHHSFSDHEQIIDAIIHREATQASNAMRKHLQTVEDRLVGRT